MPGDPCPGPGSTAVDPASHARLDSALSLRLEFLADSQSASRPAGCGRSLGTTDIRSRK